MKRTIVNILLSVLCALTAFPAFSAGKVTFEANSPLMVAVGEAFRVEFTLTASPDDNSFTPPDFKGFDVVAGPVLSTGRQYSSVNGVSSGWVTMCTITYVLVAQEAGVYTVGAAEISSDGKSYRTSPLQIEAVQESGTNVRERNDAQEQQQRAEGAQERVGKDDILLRAVVSRTSVFKGEPLRVAFKLYQRVDIVGFDGAKFPSFNGFWAQELDDGNARRQRETLDGKVYETVVVKEYLLYPQQSGTLTIEPAEVTAVAQVVVQNRSRGFDPFGGPEVYNVRRTVSTPRIEIAVKELPAGAPASFNGAVGRFTMETKLPSEQLTANSAATYVVRIAGTGNLNFVQAPKLTLPASFEQYDVSTIEQIKASASGASGYRQFEYPFIARAEGDYTVEPVEFTYFSLEQQKYVTISSKELNLVVAPDAKGSDGESYVVRKGLSKEDVKLLGQDIRFIRMGTPGIRVVGAPFLFSGGYFAVLGLLLLLFAAIYVALRRRIRESQNVVLLRGKRANKVAVQRFRTAKRYMTEENRHAFYEEMLRALWGYMSDKFNIPMANLTKENVREELHKRGVAAEETQRFSAIISLCDEAQYSPVGSGQMSDVYTEGVDLISRIESVIKR